MWEVKNSKSAKRRANKLFGDQEFDFTDVKDTKIGDVSLSDSPFGASSMILMLLSCIV